MKIFFASQPIVSMRVVRNTRAFRVVHFLISGDLPIRGLFMDRIPNNTYRDRFKPGRCRFASNTIDFGTAPIHFEVPVYRLVSIPSGFGPGRIGIELPTHDFGPFRYHFKSNRDRNDCKQLPLGSIKCSDTRFFDIVSSQTDITLSQPDIVSGHCEISWSRRRFAPGLRQFTSFQRRLSSGPSDIAPCQTDVSAPRTRLSLRRSDVDLAPRNRQRGAGGSLSRFRIIG